MCSGACLRSVAASDSGIHSTVVAAIVTALAMEMRCAAVRLLGWRAGAAWAEAEYKTWVAVMRSQGLVRRGIWTG